MLNTIIDIFIKAYIHCVVTTLNSRLVLVRFRYGILIFYGLNFLVVRYVTLLPLYGSI